VKKIDDGKKEKKYGLRSKKTQNANYAKVEEKIEMIKDLENYELYMQRCFPIVEKTLSDNLDILELHDFVLKKLQFEKQHKTNIVSYLIGLERQKLSKPMYKIELITQMRNIRNLQTQLDDLNNEKKMNEYLSKVSFLIEVFQLIGYKKKVISFGNIKQNKKDDIYNKHRRFVIEKYIDIFKNYHDINITYPCNTKTLCQVCKYDLTKYMSEDVGGVVCPRCNTEKTILMHTCIVSDSKFSNTKDGYEDRENFWKALQRFQGKQNNHIPERLYKELDEYFKSFGLPCGEEICKFELSKKGTRGNTSRSMMFKALSETNNSVFYEDVNLICHLYWGWLLPDISADEDQIMNDYDMTQDVFKKIPKDRRSSLNAQYRLWQHLRIRGYKYPIDDFKIVKTPDILVEHDRIMKIMCEECKLPFLPAL
jgi:hypothetical protein